MNNKRFLEKVGMHTSRGIQPHSTFNTVIKHLIIKACRQSRPRH